MGRLSSVNICGSLNGSVSVNGKWPFRYADVSRGGWGHWPWERKSWLEVPCQCLDSWCLLYTWLASSTAPRWIACSVSRLGCDCCLNSWPFSACGPSKEASESYFYNPRGICLIFFFPIERSQKPLAFIHTENGRCALWAGYHFLWSSHTKHLNPHSILDSSISQPRESVRWVCGVCLLVWVWWGQCWERWRKWFRSAFYIFFGATSW